MAVKTININTNGSGAYSWAGPFKGKILGMALELGDLSTPDIDVTDPVYSKTFLSVDGVAANTQWHVGEALVSSAGVTIDALNTADTVGVYAEPICMGTLTVAVTGAGNAKSGKLHIIYTR